jgi:hypothetical protein
VHSFVAVFTTLSKLSKYVGEKPISWAKRYVDLSSSNFNVQGHLLSTGGDALRSKKYASIKPYLLKKHSNSTKSGHQFFKNVLILIFIEFSLTKAFNIL